MFVKSVLAFLSSILILSSCGTIVSWETPSDAPTVSSKSPVSNKSLSLKSSDDMPSEPGKCYARCLEADEVEVELDTLGIFGIDEEIPSALLRERIKGVATTKWVKKAVQNCHSADPNDCLVWCLQETPATEGGTPEVIQEEDRQIVVIKREQLIKKGGFTEWKQVVCDDDLSENFVTDLTIELISRGYLEGEPTSILTNEVKEALVGFQKDNRLPIGQLDVETLDALNVKY